MGTRGVSWEEREPDAGWHFIASESWVHIEMPDANARIFSLVVHDSRFGVEYRMDFSPPVSTGAYECTQVSLDV